MEQKVLEKRPSAGGELALSALQVAQRMGVSLRHVRRMDAEGLLPKPINLGRLVRWPLAELEAWLAAGAPDRKTWSRIREGLK